MEIIFNPTIITALNSGFINKKECEDVIIDTTAMEKNISYPTDSKLCQRAISRLGKLSKKHAIPLKKSYKYVSKKAMGKSNRHAHAKQYKRMKNSNKKLKTCLGRLMRDIERKIKRTEKASYFQEELTIVKRLLQQKRKDKNKLYSLHEPEVICINHGKAHKKYEYGSKVSIAITHKKGLALSVKSHSGNPYDGDTLNKVVCDINEKISSQVKQVFFDRGYRGHKIEFCDVFISGQRKGMNASLKKKLKRQSAIEPHIGHIKAEGKLRRNMLKGRIGDEINAILCGVGHHLRLLLAWTAWLLSCLNFFTPISMIKSFKLFFQKLQINFFYIFYKI
ncbi:MAG: IS5 family transposase [Endozoicomonadaceae bacterium]|nr:IS5 family transposase [Endozoicomonadaceae bacterium]